MSAKERPEFEVRLRNKRVQRELDSLREADYQRVVAKLRALAKDPRPRGCEKLIDDIYRVRVGTFRIIYLVDDKNSRIEVGAIRRRAKGTYRGIEGIFK
ncbi:MAG: type II toxin-antitoxin system RelE/ParE family toxin [Chloroflexi bacterium]|nr:type II toxin-antitoxin system RelE/ParE family toxin [Chloroflexota bacterium]MBM3155229.1 type II toxin-antitoxin system RelE/ParE family toxin [Chloroflexota bacterium]MBM3173056.1 type II toxin-antitoxin system RelE/ParE family toxin [Chloroflexota bacterium]MBM4450497.1 type II toxin-antitoxin system RelE/ParE family toxin [Chloroflexota bacterium]